MKIREAVLEDNGELQALQARCPQGTTLITSTVNAPDFFARAKVYEAYKVYVACADNHIIGSAACALREAVVNGKVRRVGYEFQYFTSPDYRRKGVAKRLHQQIEDHLTQHGAVLSYTLIMEANFPSMRLFEREGFKRHRTLVMPGVAVRKEMDISSRGKIRPVTSEDLETVAELLNETWQGFELYEPNSAESLSRFIDRTPGYRSDSLLVLEDRGEILACLGFWDWSQVMQITVVALSRELRLVGFLLTATRILPEFLKAGDTLTQIILTPIGFRDPADLAVLVRYVGNQALVRDIQQIFCICERKHELLSSLKGLIRVDTAIHLYIKPLQKNVLMGGEPVFIDGMDL